MADNGAINAGTGLANYQSLLLKQIHGLSSLVVANSFNYMIKNRIKMMCKRKSTALAKAKPLLLIPVIIGLVLIFACSGIEQPQDNITTEQADIPKPDADSLKSGIEDEIPEEAFIIVEQMPIYPGGEVALYEDIYENLDYPESALKSQISGIVLIRFVVTKEGEVTQAEVLRGLSPAIDAEAIRAVESLPEKFIPGKQAGRPLNVYWLVRIQFSPTQ